mmetsp:Transcript_47362/g.75939  ORF Transcript_47362/g.75939 Transcript_47362/m.75939 type:complete len:201 (-) Transcript_47362:246-848(-)
MEEVGRLTQMRGELVWIWIILSVVLQHFGRLRLAVFQRVLEQQWSALRRVVHGNPLRAQCRQICIHQDAKIEFVIILISGKQRICQSACISLCSFDHVWKQRSSVVGRSSPIQPVLSLVFVLREGFRRALNLALLQSGPRDDEVQVLAHGLVRHCVGKRFGGGTEDLLIERQSAVRVAYFVVYQLGPVDGSAVNVLGLHI